MIYNKEPELLREICRDKRVLEIGAYEGESTVIIAKVANWIVSIDTFNSDNIPGYSNHNTLNTYRDNIEPYNNISYIVGNSRKEVFSIPFDILFIDGDHSYNGCLNDLTRFKPLKGYLVHDWASPIFPGVMAACMNFFDRYPDKVINGLAYWDV